MLVCDYTLFSSGSFSVMFLVVGTVFIYLDIHCKWYFCIAILFLSLVFVRAIFSTTGLLFCYFFSFHYYSTSLLESTRDWLKFSFSLSLSPCMWMCSFLYRFHHYRCASPSLSLSISEAARKRDRRGVKEAGQKHIGSRILIREHKNFTCSGNNSSNTDNHNRSNSNNHQHKREIE